MTHENRFKIRNLSELSEWMWWAILFIFISWNLLRSSLNTEPKRQRWQQSNKQSSIFCTIKFQRLSFLNLQMFPICFCMKIKLTKILKILKKGFQSKYQMLSPHSALYNPKTWILVENRDVINKHANIFCLQGVPRLFSTFKAL